MSGIFTWAARPRDSTVILPSSQLLGFRLWPRLRKCIVLLSLEIEMTVHVIWYKQSANSAEVVWPVATPWKTLPVIISWHNIILIVQVFLDYRCVTFSVVCSNGSGATLKYYTQRFFFSFLSWGMYVQLINAKEASCVLLLKLYLNFVPK